VKCIEEYVQGFKTQNILMTFGDDFAYADSENTFRWIDNLINTIQQNSNRYEFKYSTYTKYLREVKEELNYRNIKLNEYNGDFLPMNSFYKEHYWNGYYTSRPSSKDGIR